MREFFRQCCATRQHLRPGNPRDRVCHLHQTSATACAHQPRASAYQAPCIMKQEREPAPPSRSQPAVPASHSHSPLGKGHTPAHPACS